MNCGHIDSIPNKRPVGRKRAITGFTLLEILVAMVIFSVVMTLIFGSFGGVFSSADHVIANSELFEMADACIGRITSDLQSIHVLDLPRYKVPETDDPVDLYRVTSKNETMGGNTYAQLSSIMAHLPISGDNREGIAEIVFYAQQDDTNTGDESYVIKRADTLYPYPEKFEPNDSDPVMCEQVREFKVTFNDKDAKEEDDWESEKTDYEYCTPTAVKVELKMGSAEAPFVFTTTVKLPMRRIVESKR